MAKDRKFMSWIGEKDHFRLIYLDQGANIKNIYHKLRIPVEIFDSKFAFSVDKQLGYLSTSVGNIGSTFTVSVMVRLTNLSEKEVVHFARKNELWV